MRKKSCKLYYIFLFFFVSLTRVFFNRHIFFSLMRHLLVCNIVSLYSNIQTLYLFVMYSLAYRFFGIQTYLFFVVKRSFSLVLVQCSKIGLPSLSQQSFLHLSCVPYLSTVNLFFLEFCDLFFIFFFLFGIFFRFFFLYLILFTILFFLKYFFLFCFPKKGDHYTRKTCNYTFYLQDYQCQLVFILQLHTQATITRCLIFF